MIISDSAVDITKMIIGPRSIWHAGFYLSSYISTQFTYQVPPGMKYKNLN